MMLPNAAMAASHELSKDAECERDAGRHALVPCAPFEAQVVACCEGGHFRQATWSILQRYGREVRAFLGGRTGSRASLDEVYAVFSEDVWRGLPSYRSRGQVRSWLYSIARHALARHHKRGQRWRSVHVPADSEDFDAMPAASRCSLPPGMGDRARLQQLLTRLDADDRQLLEQRLLRALPWREIAVEHTKHVEQTGPLSDVELERTSARLRKRYQLLVRSLRQSASLRESLA